MPTKTIMLIDDSKIDNFIHKTVLTKSNIDASIICKTSGQDALKSLKEKSEDFPEIIFLDITMPIMDGFEFLNEYQKLPENLKEKCTVYILSSSIDPMDIKRVKDYDSIKKHITKPLTIDKIEHFI